MDFFATILTLTGLINPVNTQPAHNHTDKDLINRVLNGDNQAFGVIIENTQVLVAQIICKMVPLSADQQDLAQEVYLKAFHKLSGFQYRSKLSTWIAQIAYNTSLSFLAKKKLVLPGEVRESVPDPGNVYGEEAGWAPEYMEKKERTTLLQSEIEKLPPVYKTLVTLYHQEEMSYEEIAEITDLPVGTVKSYLFRARKKLKESLLSQYKKEEL